MQNRDGIVGSWVAASNYPPQLPEETANATANLKRWEPWVRATLIDFDLYSRLHFAAEAPGFTLWDVGINAPGGAPVATTQRIVRMSRPGPGNAKPFWNKQLDILASWADLRAERNGEILAQLSPPLAFWSSIENLRPDRHRATLELLWAALRLANHVEMRFKHALACRRPVEMSAQVQPMIGTPGHGSLPSGHATEACIVAHVLWSLVHNANNSALTWFEQLMRQAARVAINRTIAGLHFPVDSAAGQVLGLALGEYFVHRATASANYGSWDFVGAAYPPALDFNWRELYQPPPNSSTRRPAAPSGYANQISATETSTVSKPLAALWGEAKAEWP
ncbi:MAG: phosphatase PAP2 family protein [Burkholderiaceae bacterium]|nr:phosphatase PAP2 family protein [Burkholderiaceae bacterium]